MWKKVFTILIVFIIGFGTGNIITKHNSHYLNDVEYANYNTLQFKEEYIKAADNLIKDVVYDKNIFPYVEEVKPESYIKYSYMNYLEDNDDEVVSYEDYKEDFEY